LFLLLLLPPLCYTLFPYTTLFRSGSSQGTKDYTQRLFESYGPETLWLHGLAIKPGKPTLLGSKHETLLIGLPGHPLSALLVYLKDRKSTRLNSSHVKISYAVFCLK